MRNSGFIATCMPTFEDEDEDEEKEVGANGVTTGAEDPEPDPDPEPWWYGAARGDAVEAPPPPDRKSVV